MSDTGQGEGWWQASDGKWYPPEQHPDYQGAATQPISAAEPPTAPPTAAMPVVPPDAPGGPPPGPPPPGAGSNNAKWIIAGVVAVLIIAIAAFLLTRDDGNKDNVAATSSSSPSSSSSSSSTSSSSSSSSKSSSSSSKSSSSSSSNPSAAELQSRLLKASDISPDFSDVTFQPDSTTPTPCGQPNPNIQYPPVTEVGSTAVNSTRDLAFQEDVSVYKDAGTAQQAFNVGLQGVSCGQGSVGSEQATFTQKDVSSEFGVPKAVEIDYQSTSAQGQLFAFLADDSIVTFQFQGSPSADTSNIPNPVDITKKGIQKLSS